MARKFSHIVSGSALGRAGAWFAVVGSLVVGLSCSAPAPDEPQPGRMREVHVGSWIIRCPESWAMFGTPDQTTSDRLVNYFSTGLGLAPPDPDRGWLIQVSVSALPRSKPAHSEVETVYLAVVNLLRNRPYEEAKIEKRGAYWVVEITGLPPTVPSYPRARIVALFGANEILNFEVLYNKDVPQAEVASLLSSAREAPTE